LTYTEYERAEVSLFPKLYVSLFWR